RRYQVREPAQPAPAGHFRARGRSVFRRLGGDSENLSDRPTGRSVRWPFCPTRRAAHAAACPEAARPLEFLAAPGESLPDGRASARLLLGCAGFGAAQSYVTSPWTASSCVFSFDATFRTGGDCPAV